LLELALGDVPVALSFECVHRMVIFSLPWFRWQKIGGGFPTGGYYAIDLCPAIR
jgi:hypothetical protein